MTTDRTENYDNTGKSKGTEKAKIPEGTERNYTDSGIDRNEILRTVVADAESMGLRDRDKVEALTARVIERLERQEVLPGLEPLLRRGNEVNHVYQVGQTSRLWSNRSWLKIIYDFGRTATEIQGGRTNG